MRMKMRLWCNLRPCARDWVACFVSWRLTAVQDEGYCDDIEDRTGRGLNDAKSASRAWDALRCWQRACPA